MTERIQIALELKNLQSLPGWRHILRILNQTAEEGWREFIDLPVDRKTSKAAYNYQAMYKAPGKILERIDDEIRAGEQDMKRLESKR